MDNLTKIVLDLINLKDEGGYWDFKEDWEEKSKNADLLHDIICMANNLIDRDAYIIFGIKDKTFEVIGIENSNNRKNSQNIIDFLKDKKFVGGIRPEIDLKTLNISNHQLDVLIIKNTSNTPYYLEESYRDVLPYHIYTRIRDTNTPKNNSADIDKVEYLWKKRFGMDKSGLERMKLLLDDYMYWEKDLGNKDDMFHKYNPDYKIHIDESNEYKDPLCDFYLNNYSTLYKAKLYYSSTILYETNILAVDEFRKYIVLPKNGLYDNSDFDSRYYYYLLDSIDGKLLKLLTDGSYDLRSREYYDLPILLFKSVDDKNSFEKYAKENKEKNFESEIAEFKKMIDTRFFNNKHDSYIKSYILYKNWDLINN